MPYPSKKFRQNPFTSLRVIRRTDRQTDRTKNITSFFGRGNKYHIHTYAHVVQVLGISHLSRDLKYCDEFLACGREALPTEMQSDDSTSASVPAAVPGGAAGAGAGQSRRRAQTPYHEQALQGINVNDTANYQRLKKGTKWSTAVGTGDFHGRSVYPSVRS